MENRGIVVWFPVKDISLLNIIDQIFQVFYFVSSIEGYHENLTKYNQMYFLNVIHQTQYMQRTNPHSKTTYFKIFKIILYFSRGYMFRPQSIIRYLQDKVAEFYAFFLRAL